MVPRLFSKRVRVFGLNDYSKREGHLTFEQEKALKKHFTDNPPSDTHVIRAHSTRLIAKYRLYIGLKLTALDNIFARQKGLPPGHAISSS